LGWSHPRRGAPGNATLHQSQFSSKYDASQFGTPPQSLVDRLKLDGFARTTSGTWHNAVVYRQPIQ
jgi:hypothetical protein